MKPKILEVIKVTAGKNHVWVNTDVGIIRKPINSIIDQIADGIVTEIRNENNLQKNK